MNLGLAKALDRHGGSLLGRGVALWDGIRSWGHPPRPVGPVDRILLIKFWGLGNWALLRPVVRDLRAHRPGARITIVTLAANRPLVEDLADDLHLVPARGVAGTLRALMRTAAWLRRHPHPLSLDFEQFSRTGALLARLGGVAQRIGFRCGHPGRDGLQTVQVPFDEGCHDTRNFRNLAEAAGVPRGPYLPGGLPVSEAARQRLARRWGSEAPTVLLHPGSGDNFPGRRWSRRGFEAAGRLAVALGHRVGVTGGPGERDLTDAVAAGIGPGALSLAGCLDLHELVALVADAQVLLSNDTGPVHIASQVGTPVLAFFGPNTPVLYGPLSTGSRAFYRDLPCSPCLTNASYRSSRCRIPVCMDTLATGEVLASLRRILAPSGQGVAS